MSAASWMAPVLAACAAGLSLATPSRDRLPQPQATARVARDRVGRPAALAGVGAGCAAYLLVGGTAAPIAAVVVAVVIWRLVLRMEPPATRRRREALERALPLTVDLLAAALAAGQATGQAVELVAEAVETPMADELTGLAARLRLGADPGSVWGRLAADSTPLRPVGRVVMRAGRSGASVSEAMNRLADDLRRDRRAVTEARARTVGVKAAIPLGLCLLPAFVLIGVVPLVVGSVSTLLGR